MISDSQQLKCFHRHCMHVTDETMTQDCSITAANTLDDSMHGHQGDCRQLVNGWDHHSGDASLSAKYLRALYVQYVG